MADGEKDHPGRWDKAVSEKDLTEIFSSLTDVTKNFFRKSTVEQMYKKSSGHLGKNILSL